MEDGGLGINERVFLLGVMTQEKGQSLNDLVLALANTGMFTPKEGKRIRKNLEAEGYLSEGSLTVKGLIEAKKAEAEFKL
ncbi:hypothetical protein [Nitratifractor salsuginis]|uniref:Uncharacterized protein n=1 Tax=Nitratifractor salsuginis (strain DSM 16511 / JCM 12458 / E9I37-1) TaxID=749222 RepID=E6X257_NITSE|nr:hypothetical protein [Nitratifractor salsuginis]ADV47126.1 hypothetical protein Nitsa_1882 [Nitratifractor salsuginis DSM 16511]